MMNTTFSLQRVKLLLIRYFVENWKINIFFLIPIFIVGLISVSMPIYVVLLCFFTGTYVYNFSRSDQNTHYFMIPASTFEKFTVNLFLTYIYLTTIFILTTFLGVISRAIFTFVIDNKNIDFLTIISMFFSQFNFKFILSVFVIQSVIMFGTIYFKKNALLKTISIIIGYLLIQLSIFIIIFVSKIEILNNEVFEKIFMEHTLFTHSEVYFSIFTICFFWILSYLRLRETEV